MNAGGLVDLAAAALREADRKADRDAAWKALRSGPKKVVLPLFIRGIPGLAAKFEQTVPGSYLSDPRGGDYIVSCVCGEEPVAVLGRLVECGCGRWFYNVGAQVHVARLEPESEQDEQAA